MSETTQTTLGKLVANGHLELGDGYRTKRSELGEPGVPVLRVADVQDGRIAPSYTDYVHERNLRSMGNKVSQPGDVVLTTKGTVGRVALMPDDADRFVYSPQLCYFRMRSDSPLLPRYLLYWLKSSSFWSQAGSRKSQTDMADYINLSDLRSLAIQFPSIDQQRSICDVLGGLDDKTNSDELCVVRAEEFARAYVAHSLGHAWTATVQAVADITMGSSPPGETYNESGDGLPFYQGKRDFGFRFPSRRIWCSEPVRVAPAGATLVSVRAPVGHVNVAVEECCIGRGVAALTSKHGTPSLLFHTLAAARDVWAPFESEGTVFGSINRKQLAALEIPVVPEPKRYELEATLSALDETVRSAYVEIDRLARLRDALLPGLMSGRLKVRDAERAVEEAV